MTETIVADFTGESRHGIYRDIPIHDTDRAGQHFVLRLRVEEVTGDAGRPWPYQLESAGRSRRIRIGDPARTVTGLQTYRIVYTVQRGAVRVFPDHDECYWNLTGNEWAVPIRRVLASIELPPQAADLRAVAYIGAYGSTRRVEAIDTIGPRVVVSPPERFGPYEGLTAAVGWAKGAVHPPSSWQVVRWWLEDNRVYGMPFLVLVGMVWLWWSKGRDPRPGVRVVQYEPPDGLSPAEMGTLMDQRADLRDITATIIDLAVRGYLRIEPLETSRFGGPHVSDYRLVSLKAWEGDATLKPHERKLLWGLFDQPQSSVLLSDLEDVFYKELPAIRDELYQGLVTAGYLDSNPDTVRHGYFGVGIACPILMFVWVKLFGSMQEALVLPMLLASGLSALIIIAFGLVMPRRTLKGARTTDRIFGFLEFLQRADEDRIRRISDPRWFERGLPYALAFGVATQWARAFEGLSTQPPSWYAGRWDTFSTRRFGSDLNRAMSSMGHSLASQPRASGSGLGGGGFSGGGGGGGGGGAW